MERHAAIRSQTRPPSSPRLKITFSRLRAGQKELWMNSQRRLGVVPRNRIKFVWQLSVLRALSSLRRWLMSLWDFTHTLQILECGTLGIGVHRCSIIVIHKNWACEGIGSMWNRGRMKLDDREISLEPLVQQFYSTVWALISVRKCPWKKIQRTTLFINHQNRQSTNKLALNPNPHWET